MSSINIPSSSLKLLVILLILGITLVVYWPVGHYHFIDYDDNLYVTANSHTKQGITWDNLQWACTAVVAAIWHPLTMLSHMLDCQLYGVNAGGHHLTSVLFHLANTALLYWVLCRMFGKIWPSAFAAALFALHPLNVDSVAWIAERKNVLSTFFWVLTLASYIRYARRPHAANYLLVFISFFLGLLSKPMLVTLPCVLLLLDYWPLYRFKGQTPILNSPGTNEPEQVAYREDTSVNEGNVQATYQKTPWQLALEKAPLFILALVIGIVAVKTQHDSGTMRPDIPIPMGARLANAVVAYTAYLVKMAWPANLAIFYPHPGTSLPSWQVIGSLLALISVTGLVLWKAKRFPYLVVGWLWYLITLLPVSGVIQVGDQAMADRYAYVPLIGIFILVAWGARDIGRTLHIRGSWAIAFGSCVLIALSLVTRNQIGYWRSDHALFEHAVDVTKDNYVAETLLGTTLMSEGNLNGAIAHITNAVKINPKYANAQNDLGLALTDNGNIRDAIAHFQIAISVHENPKYYSNLGLALAREGKYDEAIANYNKALEMQPEFIAARANMAIAFETTNRYNEALTQYAAIVHFQPNSGRAQLDLAKFLIHHPNLTSQLQDLLSAEELQPFVAMFINMGSMASDHGKPLEAARDYGQALKLDPGNAEARKMLDGLRLGSTQAK